MHVSLNASLEQQQDAVQAVLAQVGELAVLPQVVFKILELTGTDDSSAAQLERVIVVDPGFSARVLGQSNSAYYALPKPVRSIREAVVFLGFKAVRQMAMTVGVYDLFIGKNDKESLRRRSWWRHSLDSAVCARLLAERIRSVNPDEAYTCGLLHWIGKTLLDRYDPEQYERVQNVVNEGAPDVLAERAVFGCDHVAVAVGAAAKWGFPDTLVQGMNYFQPTKETDEAARLRAVTCLAHKIARLALEGFGENEVTAELLPQWAMDVLHIADDQAIVLIHAGTEAVSAASAMSFH